jgi:hypothetical protein
LLRQPIVDGQFEPDAAFVPGAELGAQQPAETLRGEHLSAEFE